LQVEQGETVAILGKSGSGKSTLLSLLAGLDSPDAGSVELEAEDLGKITEKRLLQLRNEKIGIVFQQFHLFPELTASENVAIPLEIRGDLEAFQKANRALESVGLGHRLSHTPDRLSGGEKQRIAIARAFISDPSILLADEPSGNLDAKTGDEVMSVLFDRVRELGMTLILVTHDELLSKRCGRRVELVGGKLVPLL
ncbi:MAG: ABC transporter ATP-binding protein, partial [Cryobacterium sp.]|nr:ABC transporter ATP-binding protein [Oligoflexia bacterium]